MAGEVEALVQLGQLDEAGAVCELALERAPDHGRLLQSRALLALAAGEPLDPWKDRVLERAHERPFETGILQLAASVLRTEGDSQRAEDHLVTELRWRPANISARLDLRDMYREQGRLVDAVKVLRPVHNLYPDQPGWSALTAQDYLDMGRADLAEPYRLACMGHPDCP
jgi:tetratricopeptide (TPR) repeat protein